MLAISAAWDVIENRVANMRVRLQEVDPDWKGAHDGEEG